MNLLVIIIIIIIKKGPQCKAEREWYTPYQSEDPSPTISTYRQKKRKGKRVEDYVGIEQLRPKLLKLLTARSSSLRCVSAAEHQTAEQYSQTGRTKPRQHLPRSDLSWNTRQEFLKIPSLWEAAMETAQRCFSKVILESNVTHNITRSSDSFSTVPPIVNRRDWGCIVRDLETIIVLVLLAFNFILITSSSWSAARQVYYIRLGSCTAGVLHQAGKLPGRCTAPGWAAAWQVYCIMLGSCTTGVLHHAGQLHGRCTATGWAATRQVYCIRLGSCMAGVLHHAWQLHDRCTVSGWAAAQQV